MRSIIFAKRNIKEYFRSPLMLFFTIVFPIVMFFIFQIIKIGTGATDEMVPMFAVNNLIPSISVFSFSFMAMNLSLQISKDRTTSFQARLNISPMKPFDFFIGYFIPNLIIVIIQVILCFILGFIFNLKFDLSIIYAFLSLIFISTFYISIGILIGSLLNEKACSGVNTIFVNATALFSGMFFPLTDGTFKKILSFFPFLPSVAIPQSFINNVYTDLLLYFIVLIIYLIITVIISIIMFNQKLKKNL